MTKYETETVMIFNDEDEYATVHTCHKRIMTRLDKLSIKPEKVDKNGGAVVSATYHVPKGWIKITPPRNISNEQREMLRQKMISRQRAGSVLG